MELEFLGTGGGRYVTGRQRRKTAGTILRSSKGTTIHIDPGPGASVYFDREKDELDAIICSHGHIDHSNDVNAMVEVMTFINDRPGTFFGSKSVVNGHGDINPAITTYHKELCNRVEVMKDGTSFEFEDLTIKAQEMFHSDPTTAGFKISDDEKTIGFWTDSEFSEELAEFYTDCDTLIVNCIRPKGEGVKGHSSTEDLKQIADIAEPNTLIATHFGYKLLDVGVKSQEEWLKENLKCKVIMAEDGMTFPGNRTLSQFS